MVRPVRQTVAVLVLEARPVRGAFVAARLGPGLGGLRCFDRRQLGPVTPTAVEAFVAHLGDTRSGAARVGSSSASPADATKPQRLPVLLSVGLAGFEPATS
mgnify:CR=1 FL=1